jgi:hypothetical protein
MDAGYKEFLAEDDPARLVSRSVLKRLIKSMRLRGDSELHGALVKEVCSMVTKAALRCYDNNRRTLRSCDL